GSVHGEKERRLAELKASTAHGRLKLAMDYWCALWFWPLGEVDLLPSREEFLAEMHLILHGRQPGSSAYFDMLGSERLRDTLSREARTLFEMSGDAVFEPEALVQHIPRFRVVASVSEQKRFLHWPLELGDILLLEGGFDLVIGNPPWVRLNWSDKLYLSTFDPRLELRRTTSYEAMRQRSPLLSKPEWRKQYLADLRAFEGQLRFLAARQNYRHSDGKTDLYKRFIERAFDLVKHDGRVGLLHPDGHFLSPGKVELRREAYRRLIHHFQFRNSLTARMFPGIGHRVEFSVNIYRGHEREPSFKTIHNLFLPETVDACFAHDGIGDEVPGIKDANDDWELRGHADRIVDVNPETLKAFAAVMEGPDCAEAEYTRMPAPHSRQVLKVLEKFGRLPTRLSNSVENYSVNRMWAQTEAQHAGIIRKNPGFRDRPEELVLTGPNFFVGNPHFQSPGGRTHGDNESIHLEHLPEDFLPKSVYTPNIEMQEYRNELPSVPWDKRSKHSDHYRLFCRERVQAASERTLTAALYPPGIAHVLTIVSAAFAKDRDLMTAAALWMSLPLDFLMKVSGTTHVKKSCLDPLPWVELPDAALLRVLQLNCLTTWYSDLWNRNAPNLAAAPWASDDPRLPAIDCGSWTCSSGLRLDFARRQAALEIDVLVAMSLGLSFDEIIQLYRSMFPVLEGYDRDTWYDRNGRIVWTRKNLRTVGLATRKEWNKVRDMKHGTVERRFTDNSLPTGPVERTVTYEAPFTLPDRIEDYRQAWEFHSARN
ncbi:MAG: hypothetical protein OXB95_03980, partial [Rhodobacteraceae bacterium]|nr:hypothetical protein [Paracoccaceae bacterium]